MITRIQKTTEAIVNEIKAIKTIKSYSPVSCHMMRNFAQNLRAALNAQELTYEAAKNAVFAYQDAANVLNAEAFKTEAKNLINLYRDRY